jgi:hypothetical protein
MIVHGIHSSWDTVCGQYRNTVYTSLEDPVTHKTIVEVIEYLYDENGEINKSTAATKGRSIDIQV